MKKNTHPAYQKVLFVDSASGFRFVCGSTLQPNTKETFEGTEYPVSYLSISSSSHPFFTGSKQLVDSEGRVQKFQKRFGKKGDATIHETKQNLEHGNHEQPKEQKKTVEEKSPAKEQKKAAPAVNKKPATDNKKPATDNKKPATDNKKPVADAKKGNTDKKPAKDAGKSQKKK